MSTNFAHAKDHGGYNATMHMHLRRGHWGCLTGRYTPLSLISVSNGKRPIHPMRHRGWQCSAHRASSSPLSLYSAGSLTCRGFAPETVVSLNPFSAEVRWFSSTTSGTPARRNGLRMGIAGRHDGQSRAEMVASGVFREGGCVLVSRSKVRLWSGVG